MKLNHMQTMALRVGRGCPGDWIDAGHLSSALWRDAHTRGDEALIRKMQNARRGVTGYGRVMSVLASKGLMERRFNEARAAWDYRITDAGVAALAEAGW